LSRFKSTPPQDNTTSGQRCEDAVKYLIRTSVAGLFFAFSASAYAVGLSESDFEYLATQHIERNGPPIHDLSPKEQSRLHSLINDPVTANNPVARAQYVSHALAEFLDHQLWEQSHPGQLWDAPKK
jgi:hypothetical protein